uniref:Histidine kinase domain-containing protein n=1 Tax=Chromera velia CCMP2878 TaxID=1169474 RepID=A0A0G4EZI2_9ALVE|eukprot:Cvel_14416.t1-p1 / transcript=Cvel_14416.t1 / gene=Cvel_14416 / organism=Chromera_velia_CCMP2878 / gene_product=Histidine kinase 2, putative / transcript_product=Histidine kinase 2, putative / location=Cvel_scaffold1025:8787-13590(-) / protein_length=1200 / sequence_SO=supercontig / SO=protein_coding / is_pseudo=false
MADQSESSSSSSGSSSICAQNDLLDGSSSAEKQLLSAITKAHQAISSNHTLAEVLNGLLEQLVLLTRSKFGLIDEIKQDEVTRDPYLLTHALSDVSWNEKSKAFLSRGGEFRNLDSLLGLVLSSKEVIISDDARKDKRRGGKYRAPPGHPDVIAYIGIPIFFKGEFIGMAAFANRPGGYAQSHVKALEPFLTTCAVCICSHRAHELHSQMQLQRGTFMANVSHEMRTPLNGILGMCEVLEQMGPSAEQQECIQTIAASGGELLRLVENTLQLSRMSTGAQGVTLVETDLVVLLQSCIDMVAAQAYKKNLPISLEVARHLPRKVLVDRQLLMQAVVVLLANAVKFTETGGIRLICLEESPSNRPRLVGTLEDPPVELGDINSPSNPMQHSYHTLVWDGKQENISMRITVEDTGMGIPHTHVNSVFDDFLQVDFGKTREYGGAGLGLAIAKNIARTLKGGVSCESEPGVGSRFSLFLPVTPVTKSAWGPGPIRMSACGVKSSVLTKNLDPWTTSTLQCALGKLGIQLSALDEQWSRCKSASVQGGVSQRIHSGGGSFIPLFVVGQLSAEDFSSLSLDTLGERLGDLWDEARLATGLSPDKMRCAPALLLAPLTHIAELRALLAVNCRTSPPATSTGESARGDAPCGSSQEQGAVSPDLVQEERGTLTCRRSFQRRRRNGSSEKVLSDAAAVLAPPFPFDGREFAMVGSLALPVNFSSLFVLVDHLSLAQEEAQAVLNAQCPTARAGTRSRSAIGVTFYQQTASTRRAIPTAQGQEGKREEQTAASMPMPVLQPEAASAPPQPRKGSVRGRGQLSDLRTMWRLWLLHPRSSDKTHSSSHKRPSHQVNEVGERECVREEGRENGAPLRVLGGSAAAAGGRARAELRHGGSCRHFPRGEGEGDGGRGVSSEGQPEKDSKVGAAALAASGTGRRSSHSGRRVSFSADKQQQHPTADSPKPYSPPQQSSRSRSASIALSQQTRSSPVRPRGCLRSMDQEDTPEIHMLVVDDTEINRMVAGTMIHQLGLSREADFAENGLQAVNRTTELLDLGTLRWEKGDRLVILMDVHMPQMDGMEATRQIRGLQKERGLRVEEEDEDEEEGGNPIFIFGVSASWSEEYVALASEAGMNDFLAKPLTMQKLRELLERVKSEQRISKQVLLATHTHHNAVTPSRSPGPVLNRSTSNVCDSIRRTSRQALLNSARREL